MDREQPGVSGPLGFLDFLSLGRARAKNTLECRLVRACGDFELGRGFTTVVVWAGVE